MDMDDVKEVTETPDAAGELYWGDPDDPDADYLKWRAEGVREIDGEERAERVRFIYRTTHYPSEETTTANYTVPIDYTEPNYGGVRPWFVCPECGTRRRKLYLPPRRGTSRYLCRECYDLGYTSSRTSGDALKQAELRYRRAFAKADGEGRRPHPNGTQPPFLPERPKGMHHDTFEALLEEVREARDEWNREQMARLRELVEGADAPLPE